MVRHRGEIPALEPDVDKVAVAVGADSRPCVMMKFLATESKTMAQVEYDFPRTATDFFLEEQGYDLLQEYGQALAIAQLPKDAFVLDIGTGSGRMATALYAEGCSVVSVDSSREVVAKTRSRLEPVIAGSITFVIEDAAHTHFSGESFESIVCANALHEMSAPFAVLSEIWRLCTQSGKLVITEFNENGYEVMGDIHLRIHGKSHTNGSISTNEIAEWLADHFHHVEHHQLPLNHVWVASGKQKAEEHYVSSHEACFACGACNSNGLHLTFIRQDDGCVVARCVIDHSFEGYPGVVQGGIVATLLDSAMTNCLFHRGIEALTAQLNIRYREPVETGQSLTVEARLHNQRGRLYELSASVTQQGTIRATASARFLRVADTTDK